MGMFRLLISGLIIFASTAPALAAEDGFRTIVVREKTSTALINDSFTFKVMKLRGYSIDIMLAGEKRKLKLGDSFGPTDSACAVVFHEISPETRIARFQTNCP